MVIEKCFFCSLFFSVFFIVFSVLFFAGGFKGQVRWPEGPLGPKPSLFFVCFLVLFCFGGFKGQVRWPLNPPICFVGCLFPPRFKRKPCSSPKTVHFCLFFCVSFCFAFILFASPFPLSLSLSPFYFFFVFVLFCRVSVLSFHENSFKILNWKVLSGEAKLPFGEAQASESLSHKGGEAHAGTRSS